MSTADVLRQVWLFSGLSEEQLDAVSSFTFQKTFAPGELIVEEGHTGNGLYVVVSGEVEVGVLDLGVKGLGTEQQRVLARRAPVRRGHRRDGAAGRKAKNSNRTRLG